MLDKLIRTRSGGLYTFTGMKDHTAESVKSMEGYRRAWVEEAQSLSAKSLQLLRPTMRSDSELWFSWNPRFKRDPCRRVLQGASNTRRNCCAGELARQPVVSCRTGSRAKLDKANFPDEYDHVWEGAYVKVYRAPTLPAVAGRAEAGRIGRVTADPFMQIRCYWDIGGTGAKADQRRYGLFSSWGTKSAC